MHNNSVCRCITLKAFRESPAKCLLHKRSILCFVRKDQFNVFARHDFEGILKSQFCERFLHGKEFGKLILCDKKTDDEVLADCR